MQTPIRFRLGNPLFDDLFLQPLNELDDLTLFGVGHLELRQGRRCMTKKHIPVALVDAHASVSQHHVPAAVVHWSTCAGAEEVDEELLLTLDAVFGTMCPEAAQLRIGPKPRQEIIRHSTDRVVTAKTLIQRFRAHRTLLMCCRSQKASRASWREANACSEAASMPQLSDARRSRSASASSGVTHRSNITTHAHATMSR